MFIPISTDRPRKRPTVVTYWLVAANVAVYMIGSLATNWGGQSVTDFMDGLALFPIVVTDTGELANNFEWWQLFTYQFLHGGLMHLLGNMLFLFIFGPPVEDRFGRVPFVAFYLVGGAFAGLMHGAFETRFAVGANELFPSVIGASGSISGVTGAFLVLFPLTHVRILIFFFFIGVYSIPAWWFIGLAIGWDLFSHSMGGGGVAYAAHLGGYFYGAGIASVLLWRRVIPRETYDLFSMGKQAHRRRQFRELARKQERTPWSGDEAKGSRVTKGKKDSSKDAEKSERRRQIQAALSKDDLDGATSQYVNWLTIDANASMGRDAQLRIANQLFADGDHTNAASAYEIFLKRQSRDREVDQVKLMLALISARYLNDPVRAGTLLSELRKDALADEYRTLAESLETELG